MNVRESSVHLSEFERSQTRSRHEALTRALDWFAEHETELSKTHAGRWIAYSATGILVDGATQAEILGRVDREALARGEIYSAYIPAEPLNIIL